jgi:hypothetical protein
VTIRVTLRAGDSDVTPQPPPLATLRIPRQPPVITSARINRTATGLEFVATGFTTTREATQAVFAVEAVAGSTLQSTTITVNVSAVFATFFQGPQSNATGGQFRYTQPFTIQGDLNSVRSITLTLSNSVGNSQPAAANVP